MLIAFLDESYDKRIFIVGGFLSYEDEWWKIEKKWKKTLRENHLERFHAADCNNGFGEFRGWPPKRRTGLIKRLLRIIEQQEIYGIYSGVVQPAYRDEFGVKRDDDAYPLCLQHCIEIIGEKTARLPLTEKVKIIVDTCRFSGKGAEVFHFMKYGHSWDQGARLHSITYSSWQDFVPLQCADLMAYESFKLVLRGEFEQHRPERKSFEMLRRRPIFGGHFDHEAMRKLKDAIRDSHAKGE